MLGQGVIPKQIERIKSKDRFLQVKTYFIWDKFERIVTILNCTQAIYMYKLIAAL